MALRVEVCAADGFTPDQATTDRLAEIGLAGDLPWKGKRYGLVLDVGGYYKNVLTLAPALAAHSSHKSSFGAMRMRSRASLSGCRRRVRR